MKPITSEWVDKTDADFRTAERELRVTDGPNYDAVCFHSQQCAEKYLKARLIEVGAAFPKTHDLAALLNLIVPFDPDMEAARGELESLNDQAVEVRYPGNVADLSDANEAIETSRKIRDRIRAALALE